MSIGQVVFMNPNNSAHCCCDDVLTIDLPDQEIHLVVVNNAYLGSPAIQGRLMHHMLVQSSGKSTVFMRAKLLKKIPVVTEKIIEKTVVIDRCSERIEKMKQWLRERVLITAIAVFGGMSLLSLLVQIINRGH